jgi:hypothetical protein
MIITQNTEQQQTTIDGMIEDYVAFPKLSEKIQLLHDNNLTSLTPQTIYNWIQLLGYTYFPSKKSYNVDTHEKPKNIKYQMEFIKCYEAYKLNTHHLIQILLTRYEEMRKEGELEEDTRYKFKKDDNSTWIELHVFCVLNLNHVVWIWIEV